MKSSLKHLADKLIPPPAGNQDVISRDFDTRDIIHLILYADTVNNDQAAREMARLAPKLQGADDNETLYNIWHFVRHQVRYVADPIIHEDVKMPSAVWHSGFADCKSKSIMVAGLVKAFHQFGYRYRFASYDEPKEYTHVYVIVDTVNGPVIIDSVHTRFNEEVKYKYHKDYMQRELRFIHGPKSPQKVNAQIGVKSTPTLEQAFVDAPKKVLTLSDVNPVGLSQGQLLLELLDQKYALLSAYYGDLGGRLSKARGLISSAKKTGLQNFNINTSIPDELALLAFKIRQAKGKHISELVARQNIDKAASVMGWTEEAQACIDKFRPEVATWTWKNNPFKKRFVNIDYTQEINGTNYIIDSDDFRACYEDVRKRDFASRKFFNSEKWEKSSLHILYKFLEPSDAETYGSSTGTKAVFHKLAVGSLSNLSAFDEEVVTQYLENAIIRNSAAIQLPDITPIGNINLLKSAAQGSSIKVEPVSATIALITAIATAIGAAASLLTSLDSSQKVAFQSNLSGYGTAGFGPDKTDFKNKLDSLGSQANTGLIVGSVLLAAGIGLSLNKK